MSQMKQNFHSQHMYRQFSLQFLGPAPRQPGEASKYLIRDPQVIARHGRLSFRTQLACFLSSFLLLLCLFWPASSASVAEPLPRRSREVSTTRLLCGTANFFSMLYARNVHIHMYVCTLMYAHTGLQDQTPGSWSAPAMTCYKFRQTKSNACQQS